MLQRIDNARLRMLAMEREAWERKQRLGYPGARAKLKHISQAEELVRSGEAPIVKPRVIRIASPVTEERIERHQARTRAPWRWWR